MLSCFQSSYHFIFKSVKYETTSSSTFMPIFPMVTFFCFVFCFNLSNSYVMVSHCNFNFHSPNDQWCSTSFHMLICYLYYWWRFCSNILSNLIGLLSCYQVFRILFIFVNTRILQIHMICKYFLICGEPFIFFSVSFEELNFLMLIKFNLSIHILWIELSNLYLRILC